MLFQGHSFRGQLQPLPQGFRKRCEIHTQVRSCAISWSRGNLPCAWTQHPVQLWRKSPGKETQTGQDEDEAREALALRVVQVQGQRLRGRNLLECCRLGVSPTLPSSWPWMLVLPAGVAAPGGGEAVGCGWDSAPSAPQWQKSNPFVVLPAAWDPAPVLLI